MSHLAHLKERFQKNHYYSSLTAGQLAFVDAVFAGQNVLISGAAGVGKTYVSKLVFDFLQNNGVSIGKTAMTGVAALNIGGNTIHSFAGLGLGDLPVAAMITAIRKNKKAKARIETCQILVIDEVSMMKAELMDKIDMIFKYYRYSNEPFGGCQLILSADFLQLPPIWKNGEPRQFAFQSRSWKESNIIVSNLTEIVRQQGDPAFAEALNRIRVGDASGLTLIRTRIAAKVGHEGVEPVRIFCKNVDVDAMNSDRLRKLSGNALSYRAADTGDEKFRDVLDKNCLAPSQLFLKVGAQVMLLRNTGESLVNGSIGIVTHISKDRVEVKFKGVGTVDVSPVEWEVKEQTAANNKIAYRTVATRTQYPLKLAYAVTAHKVQGLTLDYALIDMSEAFSEGQVYVSLSRVRSLSALSIVDFPDSKIRVNEECLEFYRSVGASPVVYTQRAAQKIHVPIRPSQPAEPYRGRGQHRAKNQKNRKNGLSGGNMGKPAKQNYVDFIRKSDENDFYVS